jgi:cob(I)alamin adenosyltransferase
LPLVNADLSRAGDGGSSVLFNGERRSKRDAHFCALGSIDELNSHLGLARDFVAAASRESKQQQVTLNDVQMQLYQVCSFFLLFVGLHL